MRVLAVLLVLATVGVAPTPARADDVRWSVPVGGPVVRPFDEPAARFAAGHRGVDLAAPAGTPVRSAGAGTVSFAGDVAGSLHVVVAHSGGLRTSYSYLTRVDVVVGQSVARGAGIGLSGGTGENHGSGVLHFGLRIGERYVDPMALFRPPDLTELVRLVPADERARAARATAAEEVRRLLEEFGGGDDGCGGGIPVIGAAVDALCEVADWTSAQVGAALDAGLDLLAKAGARGVELVERLAVPLQELLDEVASAAADIARRALLATPLGQALQTLVAVGEYIIKATLDCDGDAPDADGTGGSGHSLLAVGGINSSRSSTDESANDLGWSELGYDAEEVEWFSYKPDSKTYGATDTYRKIVEQARSFGEQLHAEAKANPGQPIDLIGHSQGGVVIRAFLDLVYRGHEDEFPPIGKVITFASPLEGSPLATLAGRFPGPLRQLWDELGLGPPGTAPSVADLSELSDVIEQINERPLPNGIEMLSISGALDVVAPATVTGGKSVTRYTVTPGNPLPFDDHSAILRDPDALRAARSYLEGRRLPCLGLVDTLVGLAGPAVIDQVEHSLAGLPSSPI